MTPEDSAHKRPVEPVVTKDRLYQTPGSAFDSSSTTRPAVDIASLFVWSACCCCRCRAFNGEAVSVRNRIDDLMQHSGKTGGPPGDRTRDTVIKSHVLYH